MSTYPGRPSESGKPGKLERATKLLNMLEKGQIFLPQINTTWLSDLESEWLSWTGMDDETSDQVDAAAYAARHAENTCTARLDFDPRQGLPSVRWGDGYYSPWTQTINRWAGW